VRYARRKPFPAAPVLASDGRHHRWRALDKRLPCHELIGRQGPHQLAVCALTMCVEVHAFRTALDTVVALTKAPVRSLSALVELLLVARFFGGPTWKTIAPSQNSSRKSAPDPHSNPNPDPDLSQTLTTTRARNCALEACRTVAPLAEVGALATLTVVAEGVGIGTPAILGAGLANDELGGELRVGRAPAARIVALLGRCSADEHKEAKSSTGKARGRHGDWSDRTGLAAVAALEQRSELKRSEENPLRLPCTMSMTPAFFLNPQAASESTESCGT